MNSGHLYTLGTKYDYGAISLATFNMNGVNQTLYAVPAGYMSQGDLQGMSDIFWICLFLFLYLMYRAGRPQSNEENKPACARGYPDSAHRRAPTVAAPPYQSGLHRAEYEEDLEKGLLEKESRATSPSHQE